MPEWLCSLDKCYCFFFVSDWLIFCHTIMSLPWSWARIFCFSCPCWLYPNPPFATRTSRSFLHCAHLLLSFWYVAFPWSFHLHLPSAQGQRRKTCWTKIGTSNPENARKKEMEFQTHTKCEVRVLVRLYILQKITFLKARSLL